MNRKPGPPPLLALAGAALLASCSASSQAPVDDTTQVMQSLLSLLTADGKPTCIDARTRGEPLAIFRKMMTAPDPARRPLTWYTPLPLRPQDIPAVRPMPLEAVRSDRIALATSNQTRRPLPYILQGQINAAATKLSLYQDKDAIGIDEWSSAPRAQVRWWVRNRFDRACSPVYTVSNPVVAKNLAFVSVMAGHRGATYAFRKQAETWAPIGQWTDWIY